MLLPGAATSITFRPKLEKLLFTPAWVVLATVITPGSSAGMSRQSLLIGRVTLVESFGLDESLVLFARSMFELPAAATESTPWSVANATARRTDSWTAPWSPLSSHQNCHGSMK